GHLLPREPRPLHRCETQLDRGVPLPVRTESHVFWQAQQSAAPEPHLDRRNEIVESFRAPTAAMDCTLQARPVRQTGVFAAIARLSLELRNRRFGDAARADGLPHDAAASNLDAV